MDDKLARLIAELLKPELKEAVREIVREAMAERTSPVTVYTVDEAAKLMRTSREQILAYIKCKKLVSFKLERDKRTNYIHASDLMDLIERLKNAS